MKKLLLTAMAFLSMQLLIAQNTETENISEVIVCTEFHITKPLRDIVEQNPLNQDADLKDKEESHDRVARIPYMATLNPDALPKGDDPAAQKKSGGKQLKGTLQSWNGQSGSGYPPDPSGAAGTDHYVQAVNTAYRIYNKTGGSVSGPFNLGTLLFGVNMGDPIVMYDKFAGRWFISQFGTTSSKKVYIAISQTSDPTGSYYTYQFTSSKFPDYLKFSIWADGYYMTSNQTPKRVYVFERTQMLAGNSNSRAVTNTYSPANDGAFFCPLPADADGQLPPAGTPCPIFSYEDDGWGSGYVDRINIYNATVNWSGTPSLSITLAAQLPTQPFDASYNQYWNDIPQPGSSQKLDGIGGVFTYRAQHRVWTGYNTVVLNHAVKVSSTLRSFRWYELRQNISTGVWSIYQQSTYAPDALNRWLGSIAMDDNGSIGIAYAVSGTHNGTNVYPSIRYTGRNAADPLNQLTFAEVTAATGNSAQSGTNRYGDYSHTSLDPVDGTIFWHTGEFVTGGNPATKIFSFQIPVVTGLDETQSQSDIKVYTSGNQLFIKAANLPVNGKVAVDLFDINGKKLKGNTVEVTAGNLDAVLPTEGLAGGMYLVRIGKAFTSFQMVNKVIIE